LGGRKGIRRVKTEWWGAGVVIWTVKWVCAYVCDVCVHKEVLEFVVDKSVSGLTGTMMSVGRGSIIDITNFTSILILYENCVIQY